MAPRLFIPAAKLPRGGDSLRIEGSGHNHLINVLRMKAGDRFTIFDGQGVEVQAQISSLSQGCANIALGLWRQIDAQQTDITLIQGIAKGGNMEVVVQKTTELGVAHIVPVLTSRVVVKLSEQTALAKRRRWQAVAQEAARQCGRADVPEVELPRLLAQALPLLPPAPRRFALWEGSEGQPLTSCLQTLTQQDRSIQFLVGPEGGLAPDEIGVAAASGFIPVTLGRRILRTETAAIVAVTLAQAAVGGFA